MPNFSVIIISHNKPRFVKEAIQSVLDQTHQDWEAILVDSGVLLRREFFNDIKDPRIRIMPSGETPELAKTKNMASWCLNKILNAGEVHGELFMFLCDDDLLYPGAFATFWEYYTKHNREPQAMYGSQDIGLVGRDGQTLIVGKRIAKRPAGKFCRGTRLDCKVDYLQFCHAMKILDQYRAAYNTTEYHNEDKANAHHADGIFMERIGNLTTVHPISTIVSINRRTADSTNLEYATSPIGRAMATVKAKAKGARQKLFGPKPY